MNILEQVRQLPDKQNKELKALVQDEAARSVIRRLMAATLLGFCMLTKDQMRLFVKFLIESIDNLEEFGL